MAELIGTISAAGGLLVMASELREAVVQLENFVRRVQDAPRAILHLVEELQALSLTLHMLEPHRQHDRHDTLLLDRCVRLCEQSVTRIRTRVDKVVRASKFSSSSIRFAFKQKEFKELAEELERSKSSLVLTILTYMATESSQRRLYQSTTLPDYAEVLEEDGLTRDKEIIAEGRQLIGLQNSSSSKSENQEDSGVMQTLILQTSGLNSGWFFANQPSSKTTYGSETAHDDHGNFNYWHQNTDRIQGSHYRARRRRFKRYNWRIPFPLWLTSRIWDISFLHSQGLWRVTLEASSIVPKNSEILISAKTGNIDKTKQLLSNRRASLMDEDTAGWKPLQWSVILGHVDMCRFILRNSVLNDPADLIKPLLGPHSGILRFDIETQRVLWDVLLETLKDTDMGEICRDVITGPWPTELKVLAPYSSVDSMLQMLPPSWLSRNLSERRLYGHSVISYAFLTMETKLALPKRYSFHMMESINSAASIAHFKSSIGETHLHAAALWLGQCTRFDAKYVAERCLEWLKLIKALASNGAELSAICKGLTPLQRILWRWSRQYITASIQQRSLTLWLTALQDAGVDLSEYLLRELYIFNRLGNCFNWNFDLLFSSVTLVDRPDQWKVEFCTISKMEVFRLDNPPGAWTDENRIPTHVLWTPSHSERDEGTWVKVVSKTLVSATPFAVSSTDIEGGEYFNLVETPQDDHGPIALRVGARRHHSLKRRSASQPPNLRRREAAFCANNIARYEFLPWSHPSGRNRYWVTTCHICPFDSKLRFDCRPDPNSIEDHLRDRYYVGISLRHCMRGISVQTRAQDTEDWRMWSFEGKVVRATLYDEINFDPDAGSTT